MQDRQSMSLVKMLSSTGSDSSFGTALADQVPMLSYVRLFFDLCLFRQPAENVPQSDTLLFVTGAAAIVTGAFTALPNERISSALLLGTTQILLFAAVIWIALRLRGHRERWVQTMTGICGAVTVLQLVTIPLSSWHARLILPETQGMALTLPLMAIAAISIWTLAVMSSILRQAMQVPVAAAVLIIIGCQALLLMIVFSFFSSPGP